MPKDEKSPSKIITAVEKLEGAMVLEIKDSQTKCWIAKVKVAFITKGALCISITDIRLPFHLLIISEGRPFIIFCNEHNTCSETVKRYMRDINREYDISCMVASKGKAGKVVLNGCHTTRLTSPPEDP